MHTKEQKLVGLNPKYSDVWKVEYLVTFLNKS